MLLASAPSSVGWQRGAGTGREGGRGDDAVSAEDDVVAAVAGAEHAEVQRGAGYSPVAVGVAESESRPADRPICLLPPRSRRVRSILYMLCSALCDNRCRQDTVDHCC
ncbi:hypothetical protein BRADI_1g47586v3 [Brachypodium distachyon]|uniref:Uncharacterized protein n=1 Tax=Brachypodium distachyon TaxID=15368 RepID=A0A0Q3H8S3_BRADI|nr:hypothetical protein BRADI_1g47586v3 [Brachypodium distachyon]